jgi:LmbE family N-acetylglucosaminyl deacetylase
MEKVLVFCAHNDDNVLGAGGTLTKYAKEGVIVKTYFMSYGETSPPHLKPEIVRDIRTKESLKADKIMKGSGVIYFGIQESKFNAHMKELKIQEKVQQIIKKEKPSKVFTHSPNDPHPNHKATYKAVYAAAKNLKQALYCFEVWTPFRIRNRFTPKLVVDISSTFSTMIKALKEHKSQNVVLIQLIPATYIRAKWHGLAHGFRFAEVFDKVL